MIAEVAAHKDRVWRLPGYELPAAAIHCGSTIAEAGKGGQSLLASLGGSCPGAIPVGGGSCEVA